MNLFAHIFIRAVVYVYMIETNVPIESIPRLLKILWMVVIWLTVQNHLAVEWTNQKLHRSDLAFIQREERGYLSIINCFIDKVVTRNSFRLSKCVLWSPLNVTLRLISRMFCKELSLWRWNVIHCHRQQSFVGSHSLTWTHNIINIWLCLSELEKSF